MKDAMVAESALFGMGTVINHQVYGKNATEALAAANTETTRLEELLSRFRPHSEISGINRSAGEWGNGVGIETYEVLTKAVGFSNFGGNVATIGTKSDGSFWRVGIRHPRQENALIGAFSIAGKSVVTSGDYQRYFIGSDGQRYHHIINPATGYPSESGLISATVVADSSMVADALSTALFVAGLYQGISLLGTVPGIEAILITADLRVHITPGLIDSFVAQKGINVNIIYRKAEKQKSRRAEWFI